MVPNYFLVFLASFAGSCLLVCTTGWHGRYSMDSSFGIQKIHTQATPRIGGLAVFLGLLTGWVLASGQARVILGLTLLAAMPAFTFGVLEDFTKRVSVRTRLLATLFSGVLAWYLTGVAMQNTGLDVLDSLLQVVPLAVVFTAFAVSGVTNAINIIDGYNGLAAGAVAIMLGAIGLIALQVDDAPLASVCFLTATCALGFGIVNWPLGKLFLGDGGAYLLGFVLAWMSVLLPMRHVEINAWATLLVCAYPVLEVAFSVRRRHTRVGRSPGQPDKMHLHHLLHRRIVRHVFPNTDSTLQNSLASPLGWLCAAIPALMAVVFAQNTLLLALAFGAVTLVYAAVYTRLTQFRWCFGSATLHPRTTAVLK